ncbi:hypothetical protein NE235_36610 [Actinoallomurus spadix]|uniref:NAD(+)--protein-arginine ADP-ribosyltransferase n=1 Tax=Actinoallomurus spadix TaxID=79912 RepID=A0ABP3GD74_9ACTN|nr:hypothetical protein [Actinoallomurus spadix]MCO5991649.1 hypothetical protein [Actinoallomurus spadix]
MTRWRRAVSRRSGQGGQDAAVPTGSGDRGPARASGRAAVVVDEYDGLILLRSAPDVAPRREDVAELARALAGADEYFTLVVGADGADGELWARLGAVLDSLRAKGVTAIRLVLSGAGARRTGRPALAQRIADAWGIKVIAPDGGVLILPGGSLLAQDAAGPGHGWQSFTPGAEPVPLGPRSPAPVWQPAVTRLPSRTAGGYVVEQVPAGLLVRSAREPRAWGANLCYSTPVDADHLTVLVGASRLSGDAEVPAEEIASLLTALPAPTRSAVRLAPCGPVDLLSVAQDIAEILGDEVEVWTGLPLVIGAGAETVVRPVLIGADAEPTWAPFVETVACRPYGADGTDGPAAPRLLRWRSPLAEGAQTDTGVIRLSDRWQVAVTRSGLLVGPHGEPPTLAGRPVAPEELAIEVNLRGAPADDALFAGLSRLLSGLGADVRKFVALHRVAQPGGPDDGAFGLLRLAIEHNVSLVEPKPVEDAPAPAPPTVRTVTTPRTAPPRAEPSTPAPAVETKSSASAAEHAAPVPVSAAGPDADGSAPPTRVTLPDRVAFPRPAQAGPPPVPRPAQASSPGSVREDLSDLLRADPPADAAERPAPPSSDDPSHRPEPPAPAISTAEDPNRADPPTPTRPRQEQGARPLPPHLARIPMIPIRPKEPAAPEAPSTLTGPALAPELPAAPHAPATLGSPAAPSVPVAPASPVAPQTRGGARPPEHVAEGSAPRPNTPPLNEEPSHAPEPSAPRPHGADPEPAPSPGPPVAPGPLVASVLQPTPPPRPPAAEAPAAPAAPVTPSSSPGEHRAGPAPTAGGARPGPVAKPLRRSTETERAEFRSLVQPVWERHSAAVNRAMTQMPALRGGQADAARTDLVAVHVHLSGGLGEPDGPEPGASGGAALPHAYLACLASGLSRLPSYRGAAVRGGLPADGDLERFAPGTVLHGPGPVSALPIGQAAGLTTATGGYVIWSATGRRVRPLVASGHGAVADEIVFPPGTAFRVLGVRSAGQAPIVLLSEIVRAGSETETGDRPGVLGDADRAALERLDEALRRQEPTAGGTSPAAWPVRCAEPLGEAAGR